MRDEQGFFELDERLQRLCDLGDQLLAFVKAVDFELLPGGAHGGRSPFDPVWRHQTVVRAARRGAARGGLQPAYVGVRPKIARPGGSNTDFLIQTEKDHGLPGLINLFGIESPGVTASLVIADWVARHV